MRGVRAVVLLFVMMTVSGCVGGDAGETTEPETPEDGVVVVDDQTGETRIVRPRIATFADQEPYTHTETEDGTFELGQQWDNNGAYLSEVGYDTGSAHVRDITEKVPSGIPVQITIEVDAQLQEGDVDLWLNVPQNEVWTRTGDAPRGGWTMLEYRLVHTSSEPIELVVFYDEVEPAQSFDYVVTYEIVAQPFLLLPGVPVTVEVPRGASSIEATFNGTDTGALHVFDPQDRLVARVESADGLANHTLAPGAPVGEYVVMLDSQATGPAHLFVYAPSEAEGEPEPVAFGLVTQDIQSTDASPFAAGEAGEVTFEASRTPLQVGVQVHIDTVSEGFSVALTGPDGELLSGEIDFGTPPPFEVSPDGDMGFTFLTHVGTEGLAPGSYTGTFTPGGTNGEGRIHGWVVDYQR